MEVTYALGPFRLDPSTGVVLHGREPVPLGPRAVAVLATLVARADRYVTKDDLLTAAWPGLVVEENSLAAQVSAIRRAFRIVPGADRWIETLPKRGYRFVGPVEAVADQRGEAKALASSARSLPYPISSFIGRDHEVAQLASLLTTRRLVTIVGVGGAGKTRLAIEIATILSSRFRDGAVFLDLAPIADGATIVDAAARALGVKRDSSGPTHSALYLDIAERELLLLVDNCEHVLAACAALVHELLREVSAIRVLATSREGLHVEGEQLFRISGLTLPQTAKLDHVRASEAAALFADRARLRQPDFEIDESNRLAVATLCTRLDGLPLALELAAGRLDAFPIETIVRRLDDRLRLLTGRNDAVPRQQTLRTTIEWSYGLLGEAERVVFERLGVFTGRWALSSAEAVAAIGDIEGSSVADLVARLVDKSLVVADSESGDYRLLDAIRQFAFEKLSAGSEVRAVRLRYVLHFVDVAETASTGVFGPTEVASLARIDAVLDDVLAAFAACSDIPDGVELALRLAAAMRPYWLIRGLVETGLRVTVDALGRAQELPKSRTAATLLAAAAQLQHYAGRNEDAAAYAMRALVLGRSIGDDGVQTLALTTLANICTDRSDVKGARNHLGEALEIARRSSDSRAASVLNTTAELYRAEGNLDDATAAYEEALDIARASEIPEFVAVILVNLATTRLLQGRLDDARSLLSEGIATATQTRARIAAWAALETTAMLAAASDDPATAATIAGGAETVRQQLRLQRSPHDEGLRLRFERAARNALGCRRFDDAEMEGRKLGYDDCVRAAVAWLATPSIP